MSRSAVFLLVMGRPQLKRTLSAASTLRTGFCAFLLCCAPVISQSPGTCPQLSNLNITRIGDTLFIQRTETASSSHANDTTCICSPVSLEEQSLNITCSTQFAGGDVCQPLPLDKDNVTKVTLDENITSGNASVCLLSDCADPDCSLFDGAPDSVFIGELTSTFVNSSTVSVTWSVEGDSPPTSAEHFRITWCSQEKNCSAETYCLSNGTLEQDNVTDTSYTIGDLKPATSLWVQVSLVGLQGNSSLGCFETSAEKLDPVTDLEAHLSGVDGLRVTWKDPQNHNTPTDYYKVRYCLEKGRQRCPLDHSRSLNECTSIMAETEVKDAGYDFTNLERDAFLVIGITAFRRYASGMETNSTEVTECFSTPSPGSITNVTTQIIGSRNASLLWELQQKPGQLLKPSAYNVTWCASELPECPSNASEILATCEGPKEATKRTVSEELEIRNLHPWSTVIAEVHGLYMNGSEEIQLGEPNILCFRTLAEAPGPPEDLRIKAVETTSATISWVQPRIKNGPLDGYILKVCTANDSTSQPCTEEAMSALVTLNDSLTTEYTLTGLDPWTNYTVVLVAFNTDPNNGTEMASPEATEDFQTDATVPGSITHLAITAVTNTSFGLTWITPDFLGGNLDHYDVTHCKVENCSAHEEYGLHSGSLNARCTTRHVKTTSTQLTNLEPWTSYELSVAAVNELRNGTKVAGIAAKLCEKTKQGVPGKVGDMTVTTTADTLFVKWKRPEAPRGEIARYKIDACIDNGQVCETFDITGENDTLEYGIGNREPWTSYTVILVAENDEEDGALTGEAENKTVKTLPAAPSKPLNVVGTEEQGQFVNVTWEAPEKPRGPLDGYNVSWIIYDWLGRLTGRGSLVTTELGASIANWKPYSNYTFSVEAFHKLHDGGSLYGDAGVATFRTAVGVPGPPVLSWAVGSRSAAFYMREPQYPNGPLDGFLWCYCPAAEDCTANASRGATCIGEETATSQILLLRKLRPWSFYQFAARAFNLDSEGHQLKGQYSEASFKTDPAEPSAPVNFTLVKRESRGLFLNWSAPAHRNGDLEGYVVTWSHPDSQPINSSDVSPQNILIKGLEPYTQYEVKVRAYNIFQGERLEGPTARLLGITLAEAPGPVKDLKVVPFNNNTVRLTWRPPVDLRGELTQYVVKYNATKPGKPSMNGVSIDSPSLLSSWACQGVPLMCTFEVVDLPAEYTYTFDVRGRNAGIATDGDAFEPLVKVVVPPGDPPPPKNVSLISAVDCPAAPQPESQKAFLIYSDMFDDRNGTITSYDVVVGSPELIRDTVNKDVSWKESQNQPATPHMVTPSHWNPFRKGPSASDPMNCSTLRNKPNTMTCIIGWEECDGDRSSCNGPLKQGTEYAMYVIGYTNGGSRASTPEVFVTESIPVQGSSAGAIVGGILTAILIMVIIIGVFIIYRRQQERQKQPTSKTSSTDVSNMNNSLVHLVQMSDANGSTRKHSPQAATVQYEPPIEMEHHILKDINKPIPKKDFKEHLAMMLQDSGYRFADEYERLVELSPQYPSDVARHPANSKKNRFTNIHPFDKSRVPLSVIGDDEQTSYINASFVKGCNAEREYIAAQGPNALTVNDFWRMIWEHDVKIIIMLTQLVEGNKKKCERYWPEDNKEHSYGSVQVRKESSAERSDFILTDLKIKSDDSSKWRNVRHVFFTAWKDHGTPESPDTLIRFVRTCQGMFGPRGGAQPPILVHCTAGVGRTGTFIALDMCLQKLEVEDDIDIFHLIMDLRENRRCMVQNEKQYTYLYHCVDTIIDELCGRAVQNEPIYENVGSLMSGSTC